MSEIVLEGPCQIVNIERPEVIAVSTLDKVNLTSEEIRKDKYVLSLAD